MARAPSLLALLLVPLGLESQPERDAGSGLTGPGWLAQVQAHIAEREYRASLTADGLQAPNRAHGLRAWFEPAGVRVHDRSADGSPGLVELRLAGFGRGDALAPPGPGAVTSRDNRVEIRRPGVVEWYVNSPAGLEQGFTLESRQPGDEPLALELAIAHARASLSGDAVDFDTDAGRRLRYGKLAAFDAEGHSLPSRFEVAAADRIRLVVEDAGAAYPVVIDPLLTGTADSRLHSNQLNANLGRSVDGAGDVNGDGYDDVIVGAPSYDAGQTDEGAAFVFHGGPLGIVADGTPANAPTQLEANQTFAFLGGAFEGSRAVAGAGDVNGDGYDDVIVGARGYDSAGGFDSAAFVFLGSATGIADGSPATAATRLVGRGAFGASVAGAGDVNGDGYDDVIVGAPDSSGPTFAFDHEGEAFVFLGSASGVAHANPTTAATHLESRVVYALLGHSVAAAGDVNGDGYDDVMVGAPGYPLDGQSDAGAAFVFHGSVTGVAHGTPATAATRIESDQHPAALGAAVAGAGDVDSDGYDDVIVGARRVFGGGDFDAGAAYVFLGNASGVADGDPTTAAARLLSDQSSAFMGISVAGAGDVNADGFDDVAVGASFWDGGLLNEGAAFVFAGSAAGVAHGSTATALARVESDQQNAQLGHSVAGAGDVNGDGREDLIVGAPGWSGPAPLQGGEGAAFIYLGGSADCSNGLDDDGDGHVDRPADPGCASAADDETNPNLPCDNGVDDDGDDWSDTADPGCRDSIYTLEDPACQDGLNNDGQTGTDFDGGASLNSGVPIDVADPNCTAAWRNSESPGGCGLGYELSLLLPALAALRRRARGQIRPVIA